MRSVLFDWIAREGWIVFNWWLLVTIAGMTVLPLVVRLLSGLPDNGYTLARPAGMLLIAFVFWLLAVLGFVNNSAGSMVLAWFIVLMTALGVYFTSGSPFNWREWWRENSTVVIVTEILFIALLIGWALVRAHQNAISGTEKPMDLAFMSAIQRSEAFPPNDPWLSGYSISYYYFGYVMGAMLSTLSGVWSTTGYNMHISMLFALTGVATFGVVYNLVRSRARLSDETGLGLRRIGNNPSKPTAISIGLLGMVFMILLGNFHTAIVELPYRNLWVNDDYLLFWDTKSRVSIDESAEPVNLLAAEDRGATFWWWFDASRTITERNLNGERVNEIIDEFPQFSFLLADNHPHVMALPYAILAMGFALNLLLMWRNPNRREIVFYGVCVGALVFLNTWDSPIYIMMLVGADAIRRILQYGRLRLMDWVEMTLFGLALLVITFVAYSPFLVGFQSQLSGILPNVLHPTRFQQLFVMFGPFILILPFFVGVELWRGAQSGCLNMRLGVQVAVGVLIVLIMVVVALLIGARLVPETWAFAQQFVANNGGWNEVLTGIALRRLDPQRLITTIVLLVSIALIVARLFPRLIHTADDEITGEDASTNALVYPAATGFALMLVGVGVSLILIPEFFYLRDNFGTRMNTVFKFYYQAWVAFSVASAYAVYTILAEVRLPKPNVGVRFAFSGVLAVAIMAGMLYPVIGIYHRMFLETGRVSSAVAEPLTLDGGRSVVNANDDYLVLRCLHEHVEGSDVVVAEATGGSYDFGAAGRTGAITGIPSVIGWQGHQSQWRGTAYSESVGTRPTDIPMLYEELRFDIVEPIIERYSIDYILYGVTERSRYGAAGEDKFAERYETVCESGNSRIYRVGSTVSTVANEG